MDEYVYLVAYNEEYEGWIIDDADTRAFYDEDEAHEYASLMNKHDTTAAGYDVSRIRIS